MSVARHARPLAACLLLALPAGFARADTSPVIWDPVRTSSPDSVEELKALQDRVKTIVAQVTPSTVGLEIPDGRHIGFGSGVIVSDDGLVLTAAHVVLTRTWKTASTVRVVLPDGTKVAAKSLGVNIAADSGMVKITDKPPKNATWLGAKDGKWPAVALGKSDALRSGQWLVAMGHPGGPKQDRRPPVRVGRYDLTVRERLVRDLAPFLRTDCTLVGGDSGGPLFDLNGKLVGIHSQIRMALTHNLHVPVDNFRADWDKMLKGDIIPPTSDAELGVELDDKADGAKVVTVIANGPAATGGLKSGDSIVEFNGDKVGSADDLLLMLALCDPGDRVKVRVDRGDKSIDLKVILGRKSKKSAK